MTCRRSAVQVRGKSGPLHPPVLAAVARTVGAAFVTLLSAHLGAAADSLTGHAVVIDGDTIEIAGERIQLNSVDAPEEWQVCLDETGADYGCGKESALALDAFLSASRPTRCEFSGRDRYGRFIGTCFRADGTDVNRWLVATGNAIGKEIYSNGLYASAQEMARSLGAGIWRGQPGHACTTRAGRVKRQPNC